MLYASCGVISVTFINIYEYYQFFYFKVICNSYHVALVVGMLRDWFLLLAENNTMHDMTFKEKKEEIWLSRMTKAPQVKIGI